MLKLLAGLPKGEPVPAISLRQPWAAGLIHYTKDIENRSNWPFKYRGPMLIHASKQAFLEDFDAFARIIQLEEDLPQSELDAMNPKHPQFNHGVFAQGCIVGVALLADVLGPDDSIDDDHPLSESPWGDEESNYWLHFTASEPCLPFDWKGAVGLFKIPYDVAIGLKSLSELGST